MQPAQIFVSFGPVCLLPWWAILWGHVVVAGANLAGSNVVFYGDGDKLVAFAVALAHVAFHMTVHALVIVNAIGAVISNLHVRLACRAYVADPVCRLFDGGRYRLPWRYWAGISVGISQLLLTHGVCGIWRL